VLFSRQESGVFMSGKTSHFGMLVSMIFLLSIAACQSGSGLNGRAQDASAVDFVLSPPQLDALEAFDKGEKRLLGVQNRGLTTPGVSGKIATLIRQRYGVKTRDVKDVVRSGDDRSSLMEEFQYIREYNAKIAELLRVELEESGALDE